MGRLFWKIFLFTILVQIIATLGIGGAIWLKHFHNNAQPTQLDQSPPAAFMIESAAATLHFGGSAALQALLSNSDPEHPIFVVSNDNIELLHRKINPDIIIQARRMTDANQLRFARQVMSKEGFQYLLFAPATENHYEAPPTINVDPRGSSPPKPPPNEALHPYIPMGSAILCSLLSAAFLAWYFSKPIKHLRLAFEQVASGNLTIHLSATLGTRRDELNDLGRDFDSMVNRLQILLDGQRRLLHDVSHELRSPLARLQVAIGLARQQPEKINASLNKIEQESARMDKLVEELLTLSKLEAGAQSPQQEAVSLEELMADILEDTRFEANAIGQQISFQGNCAGAIIGDVELLHRAVENVIRNALKHSDTNFPVTITSSMDPQNNLWQLTVTDHGPGVPDSDLEAIFKPFFRSAQSKQNNGHGLGLAITRHIIDAHHGTIKATNGVKDGLIVVISLPATPSTENY